MMFDAPSKRARGASAVALTTVVAASAAAWTATSGSAEPVAQPSAAKVASASALVRSANEEGPDLNLDAARARRVDTSSAPSGMAGTDVVVVPSAKGPCLLFNDQERGTGPDAASKALVHLGSLKCGAGVAPTTVQTEGGTIGAVNPGESVEIVAADGTAVAARVDTNGVWFAPLGASKALVTSGGSTTEVNLLEP